MNKSEFIRLVTEKTEMAKKDVEKVINEAIECIIDTVKNDEKVQLVGFGTFERRFRASRKGRNPATGEEITIPALHVPVFKAGKAFKDRVK